MTLTFEKTGTTPHIDRSREALALALGSQSEAAASLGEISVRTAS